MTASTFYNRVAFNAASAGLGSFVFGSSVTGFRTPLGASIPDNTVVSYTAQNSPTSFNPTEWETGQGTYHLGTNSISRDTIRESSAGGAVNFSGPPLIFLDYQAQDIISIPVGVASGGIGTTSLPVDAILLGNSTSALATITATTAGYPLISAGSASPATFTAINVTAIVGTLSVATGGIGTTSLPLDGIVLGNSTNALTVVTATTAGFVLASQGSTNPPAWTTTVNTLQNQSGLSVLGVVGTAVAQPQAITGTTDQVLRVAQNGTTLGFGAINLATSAAVTGVLAVPNGGISTASLPTNAVLLGNNTGALQVVAATTASLVLTSQGSTNPPAYTSVVSALGVPIVVASGGIGTTSLPLDGVVLGNATNALQVVAATTSGFILTSQGSASAPIWSAVILDIPFVMNGGGTTISTGVAGYIFMDFACTIRQSTLLANASGTAIIDIWKCTYAQFDGGVTHPVVGDSITASALPTTNNSAKAQDATLTGWTTTINAGDVLAFNVNTVGALMTLVTETLKVTKN